MRAAALLLTALGLACAGKNPQPSASSQEVTSEMAQTLVRHHAYDTAIPLLRQALAGDPNNAGLRRSLGIILSEQGLHEQARGELQYAYRLAPRQAATVAAIAILYDQQGLGDLAERWHRRAIVLAPDEAEYFNNLGFNLYLQTRNTEALAAYDEALRRDPAHLRAHNNRGFALARLGRRSEALRAFQEGGGQAQALVNLGLAHALVGERDLARRAYKDALSLDKYQTAAQHNLAALEAEGATRPEGSSL